MQSPVSFLRLAGLGAVCAIVPFSLCAQDDPETDWNHFGLNFRAGFNIRAKFSEPTSGSVFPPGPGAGLALNHQYNDGFVNVDSSGNQGGQTWNWGYQHASQISGGDVLMHATGSEGGSEEHSSDDPNPGFDFNYVRDIGHYSWGQWGIKIASGYTHVHVRDNDPMNVKLETLTDTYALNGVIPPLAPYSGSFSGPGPVLGSEPISRALGTSEGIITGNHNVNAALVDLRLGPSINIPLFKRFSVQAGGGVAVGLVDSHFTFTENSMTGSGSVSGGNNHTGFVGGAYAEAGFAYRICHSTSIFTGAQFEYLGNFTQSADGRSAQLKLGQNIFYEIGLQWQF
jgi:hypothetical protein